MLRFGSTIRTTCLPINVLKLPAVLPLPLQVDSYLSHILTCLEQVPDVTEIEINSEGHWRPAGSSSVFMSVLEQRKDMAAAAAEAAAAARTVGQVAAAAAAAGSEDDDDDDPAAELRWAGLRAIRYAQFFDECGAWCLTHR